MIGPRSLAGLQRPGNHLARQRRTWWRRAWRRARPRRSRRPGQVHLRVFGALRSDRRVILHVLQPVAVSRNAADRLDLYDGRLLHQGDAGHPVLHALEVGSQLEVRADDSRLPSCGIFLVLAAGPRRRHAQSAIHDRSGGKDSPSGAHAGQRAWPTAEHDDGPESHRCRTPKGATTIVRTDSLPTVGQVRERSVDWRPTGDSGVGSGPLRRRVLHRRVLRLMAGTIYTMPFAIEISHQVTHRYGSRLGADSI